jgi:hypothetical protein
MSSVPLVETARKAASVCGPESDRQDRAGSDMPEEVVGVAPLVV